MAEDVRVRNRKLSLTQFLALLERKKVVPKQMSPTEATKKFAQFAGAGNSFLQYDEFRQLMLSIKTSMACLDIETKEIVEESCEQV
jgi:hypothetical protein